MKKRSNKKTITQFFGILVVLVSMILTANASAVRTAPVSLSSNGQLIGGSWQVTVGPPGIIPHFTSLSDATPDGGLVVFTTTIGADYFIAGVQDNHDTNATNDVFVRNMRTGELTCVSCEVLMGIFRAKSGSTPRISANGRYVVYSGLQNLTANQQIIRVDLQTGAIDLVTIGTDGLAGDFDSMSPVISNDGRYIAFISFARNLVSGYPSSGGGIQLFVRDMQSNQTFLASHAVGSISQPGNAQIDTVQPVSMTGDGRFVAFTSPASNYRAPGTDTNGVNDVYLFDTSAPTLNVGNISYNMAGNNTGNGASFGAIISPDSTSTSLRILFASNATDISPIDTNPATDIYCYIGETADRALVSVARDGTAANGASLSYATISRNGRFVAFTSKASNLVNGIDEPNAATNDVFLRDLVMNTTNYVSLNNAGVPSNTPDGTSLHTPFFAQRTNLYLNRNISDDGRYVAFSTTEAMSVRDNNTTSTDIYVRDVRSGVSILASLNRFINGGQNAGLDTRGDVALSSDGRNLVYGTRATNLVSGDATTTQNTKVFHSNISLLSQRSISDFSGDGRNDFAVFRPLETSWYSLFDAVGGGYTSVLFGENGNRIVPGDYDGDGATDHAVFLPASGRWEILQSTNNELITKFFGTASDVIAPADFDGDGRTDLAFFRPSNGNWYILQSNTNSLRSVKFGLNGDIPVVGDYDGDNKADIAIFRPSTGDWWILQSTNNGVTGFQWGVSTDKPLTGDFDGDGKSDAAVFRSGTWYTLNSRDGSAGIQQFGVSDDRPVASDYDGDGRYDIAVFRPSDGRWYVLQSSNQSLSVANWGVNSDIPVSSAYIP